LGDTLPHHEATARPKTRNSGARFSMVRRWLSVLAVACQALPALSGPHDDGLRLAAEGRCAEALPLLADADAPDALRARALCHLQLADYPAAAAELAPLEAREPALAVELGVARFHARDLAGAEGALRRAEAAGNPRAEVPLYLGLIALEREQAEAAARSFDLARASSADPLAPAASYYAGLAHARSGEPAAAREALQRVAREWPGSAWAAAAERALASLDAGRPAFASLRIGFEHDTNAVLRGDGVDLPPEIPSQSDQRFVWRGVAGRTWSRSAGAQLGGALAFAGSAHGDLTRFDALQPSLTLWADRRLGEDTVLRGLAAYSHAWVGTDEFLSTPSFGVALLRAWERGAARFFAEVALDDYRFESTDTVPALRRRRDRDGLGARVGAEHSFPLPDLQATLTGSVAYRGFNADGSEYSFDSPEVELSWEAALPAELVLTAGARYAYRAYRNRTTYELPRTPKRTEHEWRTEIALHRPMGRQLSLETRWFYQRNRSTADVFDFNRHVVGLFASWTLNP